KMKPEMNTNEHRCPLLSQKSFADWPGILLNNSFTAERRSSQRILFFSFFPLRLRGEIFGLRLGRSVFICVHLWFRLRFRRAISGFLPALPRPIVRGDGRSGQSPSFPDVPGS